MPERDAIVADWATRSAKLRRGRFADQTAAGRRLLDQDGVPLAEIVVGQEVDLLFRGQSHVFWVPVIAPDFDPRVVLADFLERYKARLDIELPEMTAMPANLRTTIIGRRSAVDLAILPPPPPARCSGVGLSAIALSRGPLTRRLAPARRLGNPVGRRNGRRLMGTEREVEVARIGAEEVPRLAPNARSKAAL